MFKSDEFMQRKMPGEIADPHTIVVPITSDKGLCGAVNTAIVRDIKKMIPTMNRSKTKLFCIG